MSERTQAFLTAFAGLEKAINSKFDEDGYKAFRTQIRELAKTNSLIRRYKEDIDLYADLRNVLVHNRFKGNYLAEPLPEITNQLRELASKLISPPRIIDSFSVEIREFSLNDSMKSVYTFLGDKDHSQVFYRNKVGRLGCLSARTLQRWAAHQVEIGLIDLETPIATVLQYSENLAEVSFVPRGAIVTDAQKYFGNLNSPFQVAVIVTENGKPTEKPLALVTAWDLGEIERLINGERA